MAYKGHTDVSYNIKLSHSIHRIVDKYMYTCNKDTLAKASILFYELCPYSAKLTGTTVAGVEPRPQGSQLLRELLAVDLCFTSGAGASSTAAPSL